MAKGRAWKCLTISRGKPRGTGRWRKNAARWASYSPTKACAFNTANSPRLTPNWRKMRIESRPISRFSTDRLKRRRNRGDPPIERLLNDMLISQKANGSNLQPFYKDPGDRLGHGNA